MQRIKNDVMSLIQKIVLNFFEEPQYRKIVRNKFHRSQTQVKTTVKIDIQINEKNGEKMCKSCFQVNLPI